MVSITIQQDMSSIPPMTSLIIDLSSRPESPKVHQQFKATTTETTTTTTLPPPPTQQQRNAEAMMIKRIGELEHIMANLIQVNKDMEERLDKHGARLYMLEQLDILTGEQSSLEKSMNCDHSEELTQDLAEARKKKKKSRESPKMPHGSPPHHPPPPPPPVGSSGASRAPRASESSQPPPPPPHPPSSTIQESPSKGSAPPSSTQTAASAEYQAWTTTDVRLRLSISLTPRDLEMDEDMDWWKPLEEERPATPELAWSIPSSDAPVPPNKWASALASSYSPPPEDSLLAQTGDIATFIDWFCKRRGILKTWKALRLKSLSMDDPILRHSVSKPLLLGDLSGQVSIQSNFFFNKDLEYLRYDSKGNRPALSISKMKAAYYPDAGLEQMVPDYVVRIEVFSLYGYDYMKKIVFHRVDLNEHVIAERDFKYLYPSDFEDLYLLNLQGHLNHLPPKDKKILSTAVNQWTRHLVIRQRVEDFQLGIESFQTQLNLTKPRWDATGFEYKHDYTVIDSPRAVMFRDKYGVQMMMRFNEIHKFSDGTLQQIDETLDYRVKEFRINMMNLGLNTRFWTRKDIDCEDGNSAKANIKQALANELTDAFGKPFEVLNNVFEHWVFNSLVHSFGALSTLRRSGLRTASTAAKPCQGDSSEFYLITGRIPTVAAAGQKDVNSQLDAHTSNSLSMIAKRPTTQLPQL
nr:hypothetical protein [Tanacetum cinerariifolium]